MKLEDPPVALIAEKEPMRRAKGEPGGQIDTCRKQKPEGCRDNVSDFLSADEEEEKADAEGEGQTLHLRRRGSREHQTGQKLTSFLEGPRADQQGACQRLEKE